MGEVEFRLGDEERWLENVWPSAQQIEWPPFNDPWPRLTAIATIDLHLKWRHDLLHRGLTRSSPPL